MMGCESLNEFFLGVYRRISIINYLLTFFHLHPFEFLLSVLVIL